MEKRNVWRDSMSFISACVGWSIAIDGLGKDGLFIKASELTPRLVVWKYNLCGMVLHQIIKMQDTFLNGQDGWVHINQGVL